MAENYNILYLVNCKYVQTKMSRVRFHSIEAISKLKNINLAIWGLGFPNYNNNLTVQENIDNYDYPPNIKIFDIVIVYKPQEYKNFGEVSLTKVIRYNEMYDKKLTMDEINKIKPNIVICHHYNDYLEYLNIYSKSSDLDKPKFYHIDHCANPSIFKDYGLTKKYDITFSGAIGNSILGDHYPLRTRMLKILHGLSRDPEFSSKYTIYFHQHPGYEHDDSYTNKYAIELSKIYNQSRICITCSGAPKSRFGKYVEIPMSKSVIAGDVPEKPIIGNPIIAFDPEIKDIIIELSADPEKQTDQEIIELLTSYLEDPVKLEILQNKGYQWANRNYTQDNYSKRFLSVINSYYYQSNIIVRSLWIGDDQSFTKMEQMTVKSYIKNGHIFYLYLYDGLGLRPSSGKIQELFKEELESKKLVIKNGKDVLPEGDIFTYQNGSFSAFSNLFRFMMLYKYGGYWVDMDLVNIKPLLLNSEYVLVTEPSPDYIETKAVPTSCLIKMPRGSPAAREACEIILSKKRDVINGNLKWGLGPITLKTIMEKYQLQRYLKPPIIVCSCHPNDSLSLIIPENVTKLNNLGIIKNQNIVQSIDSIPDEMYGIHLWNQVFRDHNIDKNKNYPKDSLLEQLKQMYL